MFPRAVPCEGLAGARPADLDGGRKPAMTSRVLRTAAVVVALGACSQPLAPVPPLVLSPDAVRLAAQATFGPTAAVVHDIEQRGAAAWIDAQLQLPPSDLGTYPVVADNANAVCPMGSAAVCYRDNFTPFLTQAAFFRNALSRTGSAAPAGGLRALADRGRLRGGGPSELRGRRVREAAPARRLRQLPAAPGGRHPQPGHGSVPEHGEQRQAEPGEGERAQRELRARGDAAVLHRPRAARAGWHRR